MTSRAAPTPLRVEQALRLLPDVDAMAPLRAFLVSNSRVGGAGAPYVTVGKRHINPRDLKSLVPQAVGRVTDHLAVLYDSAVAALEAEQQGDLAGAVRELLRAAEQEAGVGRHSQAHEWCRHALRVAEELRDRRPEIETLIDLGRLDATRGRLEEAGRAFQRALALADADMDDVSAAQACLGLGHVALEQAKWQGAEAWFTRGVKYAASDAGLMGALYLGLAAAARGRERLEPAAGWLARAEQVFTERRDGEGSARMLDQRGLLEAMRGEHNEALASYRDALARIPPKTEPALEMAIRLNICHLYLEWGRLPDAEDEARRAEETAIVHNLARQLARLYLLMGEVRGRMNDETGFVFFEKAVELCRGREPLPRLEAEAYLGYGLFRARFGEVAEARAYLERAREVLETAGDGPVLARIDAEIAKLPME